MRSETVLVCNYNGGPGFKGQFYAEFYEIFWVFVLQVSRFRWRTWSWWVRPWRGTGWCGDCMTSRPRTWAATAWSASRQKPTSTAERSLRPTSAPRHARDHFPTNSYYFRQFSSTYSTVIKKTSPDFRLILGSIFSKSVENFEKHQR